MNEIGTQRARLAVAGARSATIESLGRQPAGDVRRSRLFHAFLLFMLSIAILGLALLLIDAFVEGSDRFGIGLFTDQTGVSPAVSGFQNAIVGTLIMIAGVIVMTVPLGVGAAVYLEEYADGERWWNRMIELNIQNLAAVPSIVYGILGLAFIVRGPLDLGRVVLAGALTLGLLVLPVVIIASREAIRAVPPSIREGSLALGATQWQTIWRQVLPSSVPGIATGVILALSRAIGETAPLIVIGAATYIAFNPTGLDSAFTAMPIQIFNWISAPQEDFKLKAAAGILVLLGVLMLMNSIAIYLRNRYEKKW